MDINIVTGKSHINTDKYIFSLLRNRDKSKKHIIVAPDRCLFTLEKKLFEELDEKCFFDITVSSLTGLSKGLLLDKKDKKILTKNSGIAVVRKLLNENKDKLLSFKKAIGFMGFAKNIFETICLYKSCNIKPEDVYTDDSLSYSNLKQKDIKLIYSAYEEYLQKDYTDSFNQLTLYASLIGKDTYKDTIFYLLEYDDFTSIMYDIIYKLSRFGEGIYIACTYGKDNKNSNIYSNKVYYDLVSLYKSNGLGYKVKKSLGFNDEVRETIANNLLTYEKIEPKACDNIFVSHFDNINDEIKYTIAKLYSKAISSGEDYSNFGIIVPSVLEYGSLLTRELGKYDIPYYIDETGVLSEHNLIRVYLGIYSLIAGDFNLSEYLNILKNPILNLDSSIISDYENYLRIISATNYRVDNDTLTQGELSDFVEFIDNRKDRCKNTDDTGEFVNISREILEYILSRSEEYKSKLTPLEDRIFNQVVTKFDSIMEDYLSVFGKTRQSITEYLETSNVYFENTNISLPPISSNTVMIATDSSYLSTVNYLFIVGANEGKQPTFKLDNGLITDDEIARLPNASKINPTILSINNRKTFKYFEFYLSFNKELYISYPIAGVENTLYPSTMLLSLIKLFGLKIKNGSFSLDVINNSANSLNITNIVFNNLTPKIAVDNLLKYRKLWETYRESKTYREILNTLYAIGDKEYLDNLFDNNDKESSISLVGKHNLFRNNTTSVSQIECFYNCPYKHFVRYGLRLRDVARSRLMPNDIGTIFHEVFKLLLPYLLKNLDKDNLEDLGEVEADRLLNYVLGGNEYRDMLKNPENSIIIDSMLGELHRVVFAIIQQLKVANFKPTHYEYAFNPKDYKIEGIGLSGAIDRVDTCGDDFVIIDYKTGSNSFSNYDDVISGNKLQLLIYARLFENKSGLKPTGAFYLPISNKLGAKSTSYKYNGVMLKDRYNIENLDSTLCMPSVKSSVIRVDITKDNIPSDSQYYKKMCLSREDFDYLLDYAILQVSRAIKNIMDNNISTMPLVFDSNKVACDKCDYRGLCGYLDDNNRVVEKVDFIENLRKLEEEENGGI